jgi:hypothetical protein
VNLINLLKQEVPQKVAIILGNFILLKNHEPPKVAKLAKNPPNLVTLVRLNTFLEWEGGYDYS